MNGAGRRVRDATATQPGVFDHPGHALKAYATRCSSFFIPLAACTSFRTDSAPSSKGALYRGGDMAEAKWSCYFRVQPGQRPSAG